MIGPVDPVSLRLAAAKVKRAAGREERADASSVPRTEAATVVQLSDYALGRRRSDERPPRRPPSWAEAVMQMVHEAALATRAAILASPAIAEAAQGQLNAGRVFSLIT
ncbi:MAG: hypothetical protein AB7O67_02345 [Vicinamibacterales bacterium]